MPVGLISQLHMRVFRLVAFRRFSSASRETVSLEEYRGAHGPARGRVFTVHIYSIAKLPTQQVRFYSERILLLLAALSPATMFARC